MSCIYGFYTNQKNIKLRITADGGGDGLIQLVILKRYIIISLDQIKKSGNLGSNTLILGLNPFRHLYKVKGLAPYYKKNYKEILKFYLSTLKVKNLILVNKLKDNYYYFKKNLTFSI